MAFAAETFGNINSRSGPALRRKKSSGISPGTVVTGISVVVFAWVAATLITTQSMVLSLPGADMSAADSLTPRASAFIVPQSHLTHPARLASQTLPMNQQIRTSSVPADAPIGGAGYTATRDVVVQPKVTAADAMRAQLASALAQQASEFQQKQASATSIKGGRPVVAASPATIDHLRKVIALNFANTVLPLMQARYAAASMPTAAPADVAPQPVEIASAAPLASMPAVVDAVPLPAKDTDLPAAETLPVAANLPSVIPLARPEHVVEKTPVVASTAPARSSSDDTVAVAPPAHLTAYAKTDDDETRPKPFLNPFAAISPRGGNGTAIYDISAGTVYLPSGERLEAHSGLGHMRDNPRYVDRKNTGPTPPETYNLTYRESLFHGVQALRLTPANGARVYGRDGLLTHSYMLRGGRGESNGCVVFKDYNRFLAAFKRGEFKRIQVVARLSSPPSNIASR
ncbi:tlde1 domain-containing protein [Rhizobium sp. RCC_161_2]|uniref:tlde1 domain-containing protein n=1 Tax=Rhizobium sp. RCC_161_2 TaxID=3239219 RepID=UPI0035243E9A